ncbi:GNAT family N-acetyltransferase [Paenarthrobacter sp. Z7-10]|uniref:GNAT family N-acetyltransferase n=1 Tax=Paenarthrobacter sp. Z7-10 TaxID=2787635 RepID=UPI0022A980B6|nr:GNAT family N-acetyltransferase [Paenarthrobacter sp. Z7-10]MCZ2403772.1 GNAT family N-acetyltransferase [Paenarthrobacter sp. Z7-10]
MTELPEVSLPSSTGLAFRAIVPSDIDQWLALIERIAEAERPPWSDQRADLTHIFASSKNDPALNTVIGMDEGGTARAYGRVSKNLGGPKAIAAGGVDPQWQRRGVGSAVLAWQLAQARLRFAQERMPEARIRVHSEEDNVAERALFTGFGFDVVRYFTSMLRPLDGGLPEIAPAPEIEIVSLAPNLDEAARLAHNEVFADHWGSEPRDREAWGFMLGHPLSRADWNTLALERSSGEVVGYQLASYDPQVLAREGRAEGYTELLGVRRKWRGRKVAAALLADAMQRFKAAGMDYAGLDVDTENPSGALGLYERMGYRATHRSMAWDLLLE